MDKKHFSSQEESVYRTGSTRPPKNYGGLIAVLLVAVIFLCGINGVLGLMNIRLLGKLQAATETTLSAGVNFSDSATENKALPAADTTCTQLPFGMQGCALSGFDQMLYRLPEGIYITFVTPDGTADTLDIRPGDVLVQLDQQPVTDVQALTDLMASYASGQRVQATFFRDGETNTLELTVD